MRRTGPRESTLERFAPHGGAVTAIVACVVVAGVLVVWALDHDRIALWVPAAALVGAVLVYASAVRPRVLAGGGELVLRNAFSTVRIPLAAIEEHAVRQVLVVHAGGRRFSCAGVSRPVRHGFRARGTLSSADPKGMPHADFVELRLTQLIAQDREARQVEAGSSAPTDLAQAVRRDLAWPELALLATTVALLIVAILAS